MTLLKPRFYRIANELRNDPKLVEIQKNFEKAIEGYHKKCDKFKEKYGVDFRQSDNSMSNWS